MYQGSVPNPWSVEGSGRESSALWRTERLQNRENVAVHSKGLRGLVGATAISVVIVNFIQISKFVEFMYRFLFCYLFFDFVKVIFRLTHLFP